MAVRRQYRAGLILMDLCPETVPSRPMRLFSEKKTGRSEEMPEAPGAEAEDREQEAEA